MVERTLLLLDGRGVCRSVHVDLAALALSEKCPEALLMQLVTRELLSLATLCLRANLLLLQLGPLGSEVRVSSLCVLHGLLHGVGDIHGSDVDLGEREVLLTHAALKLSVQGVEHLLLDVLLGLGNGLALLIGSHGLATLI